MKKLRDGIKITEAELSRAIREVLKLHGCRCYTTEQGYRRSRGGTRTSPGIPDLLVFHPRTRRFIFVELKTPGGKVTPAQKEFGLLADGCGVAHEVWRSVSDCLLWLDADT